ncbi:MAG: CIA30 family protein, partial [Chroococcales cyanobacterium]
MTEQKRPKWDAGRFWKTLSYFGVVPFLGNISWIRNLLTGGKSTISNPEKPGVILVAGATGGV